MTTPGGQANPPAGWYPDPSGQPQQRWWDGVAWGEQTQAQVDQGMGTLPQAPYPAWSPGAGFAQPQRAGNGLSIAGIICGALALLILPIVLGPAGLILGAIAKSRGEPKANIALIVAGVGMVGGFIIGFVFAASMLNT